MALRGSVLETIGPPAVTLPILIAVSEGQRRMLRGKRGSAARRRLMSRGVVVFRQVGAVRYLLATSRSHQRRFSLLRRMPGTRQPRLSPAYIWMARPICWRLARQRVELADSRARARMG